MADTPALFSLQVIASNKVFYDEHAQYLKINTSDGFRGLMAHHAPCVVAVETGPMEIVKPNGERIEVLVSSGIMNCANNRITVLVDTCETAEEIDVRRAEEAKERALEQLRQKQSVGEFKMTQSSLARALSRLEFSSQKKHYI